MHRAPRVCTLVPLIIIEIGSQDGTVHVWSSETGQKVTVLDGGHPSPTYSVQFNPKLMMAASACNSVVREIEIERRGRRREMEGGREEGGGGGSVGESEREE